MEGAISYTGSASFHADAPLGPCGITNQVGTSSVDVVDGQIVGGNINLSAENPAETVNSCEVVTCTQSSTLSVQLGDAGNAVLTTSLGEVIGPGHLDRGCPPDEYGVGDVQVDDVLVEVDVLDSQWLAGRIVFEVEGQRFSFIEFTGAPG